MSFKAIFELCLQLESFRNIDLLHQGVYYLRFTLHHTEKGRKKLACPYHLFSAEIVRKRKQNDVHNLQPAVIQTTFNTFTTKAFLIRYCEEEVELNDVAYFRTEVGVEDLETWGLSLEAELMFSDLSGNLASETVQEELNKKPEFSPVSTAVFQLNMPTAGYHEYVPIIFDESHFCVANATLHCALVDFRHRLTSDPSSIAKKSPSQSTDAAARLSQYLFKDPQGVAKSFVGAEETDQVYSKFVTKLATSYETLRGLFIVYSSKCLTEGERENAGVCFAPPQLNLPGNSAHNPYSKSKLGIDSVNLSIAGPGFEGDDAPELSISSISPDIEDERPRGVFRFSERVASHDPVKVASVLLLEVNLIGGQILMLWHRVIELVKGYPRPVNILLQERHYDRVREKFNHCVAKNIIKTRDFTVTADNNLKELHETGANALREELQRQPPKRLPIEDSSLFSSVDMQPIIFEDVLIRERESEANILPQASITTDESYEIWDTSFTKMDWSVGLKLNRGVHLFVLVHGFQGNSFDMRLLKNHFSLLHPEALFLCSNSNEDTTEGDIGEMGVRLAQEVTAYITQWCDKNRLGRISFIGHSMGGLIIRAALPYLETLSSKMHLFLTLSTPHLGYMYNSSKIIDAGMWFLKKWRRSKCLQQLSMSDSKTLRQCLIYELSTKKGLSWFKHVVLISSYQDQYAPFDSARMEISSNAAKDPVRGGIYMEMASNLLSSLNTDTLFRIDINFKITEKSLDTFIGRAAHIQFLESQTLMKMILLRYPEFFTGKPVSPVSIAQTYYVDQSYAAEDSLQYHLHQTDDLEQIPDRSEMALIATLRSRLQLGVPFTRAGPLMLSVKSPLDPALYFNSSVKATYSSEELSPSLPPHLYSASHSAYASLKSSKQSQAIVLLGHSGSGKTFDLIHLMDHLVTLASTDSLSIEVEADKTLFKLLHSGLQALHIMGSVMSEHNLESTTCGLVVEVKYDAQFRAVGGSIRAKLMDVSLPKPRNGRTYQVLHSLICGNKQLLHGLGLHSSVPFRIFDGNAQPRLKVLDSEAWLRFVDCLNQLSLSKAEYQSFLDVLASVIHVYDVPFVCSSYTPRGSAVPSSHWVPRNRSLIQKICKLLGCTEDVFMETFTGFSSKSEAEERIVDLSRTLFEIAFTWLLEKVNEYLEIHCQSMIEVRTEAALGLQTSEKWSESKIKQEKRSIRSSFQPIYSISLVDFPGFAREETLGTLSKNLGLETLHLYCSSSYVTLLSALASERVRFKYLDSPRCKDIVDLFLGKEVALAANIGLPNSAFATYWRDLVSAAKTDGSLSRAISVSESEEFTLQYTWTSLSFSLEKIRAEAEDQFGPQLNAFFFKKCANVLLVARSNRSPYKETQLSQAKSASLGCYFGERVSNSLAYLMKPLLAISASVIYCLHSTKNEDGDVDFPLHTTVSLFRNSLIRPQIVWKWFGFTSWRTKEELMQLFDGVTARSDEGLRLVLTEILKDEFLITDRMVLMTPRQEGILWEVVDLWSKGTRDAASLRKVISAVNRTRAGPKGKEVLFGFEAPGLEEFGNVHLSSYMKQEYTYEAEGFETFSANLSDDSAAMLQELPRNKHFEKPHKKSSLKTLQAQVNTILLQSRKDFAVISKSLRTPEVIDYTELLPYILRIQAHIRGFLARKYTSVLLTFTRNVVVLQAFWRGFRARQAFKPLLLEHRAAIRIQRRFRQYRGMRIRAAIKIQRWFLKVLTKRYLAARRKKPKARAHWTGKTSVSPARDQVARNLHTGIRSAQRTKPKTPPPHDEYTFTPDISKTSSRLAKNKHNRLGSDRLPFPDRFRMMENERQRKIHQMVQMKLEQEGKDLTLTPKVNRASRSPGSKAGFYERQMERWVKLKRWKDTELIKKDAIAAEELTFIPKVKTSVRTRGIERTIQDLYTWDKLRVKELKRKQDESEQQKLSELREKVDLSPVSQRIIRERKERESISDRTMEDMLTKTLPYWPSHSPQASGVRLKQDTMH